MTAPACGSTTAPKGFEIVAVTKGSAGRGGRPQEGRHHHRRRRQAGCNELKLYELRERLRNDAPGTVVAFTVTSGYRNPKTETVTLEET